MQCVLQGSATSVTDASMSTLASLGQQQQGTHSCSPSSGRVTTRKRAKDLGKGKGKGKDGAKGKQGGAAAAAVAATLPTAARAGSDRPNHAKPESALCSVCGRLSRMWPIPIFLRMSVPLVLACIDGMIAEDSIGSPQGGNIGPAELDNFLTLGAQVPSHDVLCQSIASMNEGDIVALSAITDEFRNLSVELIGGTGAAHDIGSERAILEQGIDPKVIEHGNQSWRRRVRWICVQKH